MEHQSFPLQDTTYVIDWDFASVGSDTIRPMDEVISMCPYITVLSDEKASGDCSCACEFEHYHGRALEIYDCPITFRRHWVFPEKRDEYFYYAFAAAERDERKQAIELLEKSMAHDTAKDDFMFRP